MALVGASAAMIGGALTSSPRTPLAADRDEGITPKRLLLLSARTRFAPQTQSLKQAAVEKIVEQVLLAAQSDTSANLPEVEAKVDNALGVGVSAVHMRDVREALARLVTAKRVVGSGTGLQGRSYRLSAETEAELAGLQQSAQRRLDNVVTRLFQHAPGGVGKYFTPFLEALRLMFAEIADAYVRQITGQLHREEVAAIDAVSRAIDDVAAAFPAVDKKALRAGVMRFLVETDPEFDAIKWNLTQNSYLIRVLGLDESGFLLSKEVLGGSVLYLDTNVLIHALEPRTRHHRSFVALANACRRLGVSLRVMKESAIELKGVVDWHKDIMIKVVDQIPDTTAPKVEDVLFQAFCQAKIEDPSLTVDGFFANFEQPEESLESFGIEFTDDAWFVRAKTDPEVRALSQEIQKQFATRHPGRAKRSAAALHDALMIQWVERERAEDGRNVWLATLDTSLPMFVPTDGDGDTRPLAITLDALLQWISPIAAREGIEEDLSDIFAAALRQQIMPHENIFQLSDFLMFAEIEWSAKELPAEDVESCIRCLASTVSRLDLADPASRETLNHDVSSFFADPARKFKREVERLEGELQEKNRRLEEAASSRLAEAEEATARDQEAMRQLTERVEQVEGARTQDLADRDARIGELEESLERASASKRALITLLFFVALEGAVVIVSLKYGAGDNWLQKIVSMWALVGAAALLSVVFGWLVIGRDRLRLLHWIPRRLMKGDD